MTFLIECTICEYQRLVLQKKITERQAKLSLPCIQVRNLYKKVYCISSFHLGMGLKKYSNKVEMKECRYPMSAKNKQEMYVGYSLLAFFHLCFASALFEAHPYLK